jgi:hypothetical protein
MSQLRSAEEERRIIHGTNPDHKRTPEYSQASRDPRATVIGTRRSGELPDHESQLESY